MVRRSVVLLALLIAVGGAAWTLGSGNVGACPKPYPDPPTEVSNQTAISYATDYEATVAYNRICDAPKYGLGETTASTEHYVLDRTNGAIVVFAQQAYHYSTSSASADGATSGLYYVSNGSAVRVPHYGATHVDLDTYSGPASAETVRGDQEVGVYNFAGEPRNVTITFRFVGGDPATVVYQDAHELDGRTGIRLFDVANRTGRYELVVRTDTGRETSAEFTISESYPPPVVVYVTTDGQVRIARVPAES